MVVIDEKEVLGLRFTFTMPCYGRAMVGGVMI